MHYITLLRRCQEGVFAHVKCYRVLYLGQMIMLPEVNMHPEDKMTFSEIRKYLRLMQKRYKLASNRRERSKLLNEMQAITGFHRKYLSGW